MQCVVELLLVGWLYILKMRKFTMHCVAGIFVGNFVQIGGSLTKERELQPEPFFIAFSNILRRS